MEGTVRRRESDKWQYLFTIRDPHGRKHQVSKGGFDTESKARRALAVAIADHQRGILAPRRPVTPTLGEFVREVWVPSLDVKQTTIDSYSWLAEKYVLPRLGTKRLAAVTSDDLRTLYRWLAQSGGKRAQGLSASTVHKVAVVATNIFQHAVELRLLQESPAGAVPRRDRPKGNRADRRLSVWSQQQCQTFIQSVENEPDGFIWCLLLGTGMRRGEVAALRWSDVSLDAASPHVIVTRSRTFAGGRFVEGSPKSGRGRRITLDAGLVDVLRRRRRAQAAEKLAAGPAYSDDHYVVADRLGRPRRPDALTKGFARACERSGAPRIRLHDLRVRHEAPCIRAG